MNKQIKFKYCIDDCWIFCPYDTDNIIKSSKNTIHFKLGPTVIHIVRFKMDNSFELLLHSKVKPAFEIYINNKKTSEEYFLNGYMHNTNDAASITYYNSEIEKYYYIMGKEYSKAEWFLEKVRLL